MQHMCTISYHKSHQACGTLYGDCWHRLTFTLSLKICSLPVSSNNLLYLTLCLRPFQKASTLFDTNKENPETTLSLSEADLGLSIENTRDPRADAGVSVPACSQGEASLHGASILETLLQGSRSLCWSRKAGMGREWLCCKANKCSFQHTCSESQTAEQHSIYTVSLLLLLFSEGDFFNSFYQDLCLLRNIRKILSEDVFNH